MKNTNDRNMSRFLSIKNFAIVWNATKHTGLRLSFIHTTSEINGRFCLREKQNVVLNLRFCGEVVFLFSCNKR